MISTWPTDVKDPSWYAPLFTVLDRSTDPQVTKVAEPSNYGVVVTKPNSTVIDRFVEKPVEFVGNRINAGIYLFNPSVLERIEVSSLVRRRQELTVSPALLRSKRRSSPQLLLITNSTLMICRDSGWISDSQRITLRVSQKSLLSNTIADFQEPVSTCHI